MVNRLNKGVESSTTVKLNKANLIKQNHSESQTKERINLGISHPNDAIDTPVEVQAICNPGSNNNPIDNPIEAGQVFKNKARTMKGTELAEEENPLSTTPRP